MDRSLNHQLHDIRRQLGWGQEKMANYLGVTREWVSRLERGKEEVSELIRMKLFQIQSAVKIGSIKEEYQVADERSLYGDEKRTDITSGAKPPPPVAREVRRRFEHIMRLAGNDQSRLGWINEQMKMHLEQPLSASRRADFDASTLGRAQEILSELLPPEETELHKPGQKTGGP